MTDLRSLDAAFAELERRADDLPPGQFTPQPKSRLVPIAAAVAVVAGLAVTATTLLPEGEPAVQVGSPTATSASTQPPTSPPPTSPSAVKPPAAETPEDLADRFRAVLGDTATFTISETGFGTSISTAPPPGQKITGPLPTRYAGASFIGTLTAGGVTGGFDLLMHPEGKLANGGGCGVEPPPECRVANLPDGSILGIWDMRLETKGGITYGVDRVRPDGVVVGIHVSNISSPKGNGTKLAPRPPLTLDQVIAIISSDRW
ncbi:MAG TPA: hypothetical protein VM677_14075 [Actinokineospora sp.]|nr:hypothetical protein [Actinokineospora sp.]